MSENHKKLEKFEILVTPKKVRDPLSRILSAYLDKFNTENKVVAEYYKRWYGRYIMNTYQGGAASKDSENYKGSEKC